MCDRHILTRRKTFRQKMRHCFAGPTSSGTRLIDYWMSLTVIAALPEKAAAAAAGAVRSCQQLANQATNRCWCMPTGIAAEADIAGDGGIAYTADFATEAFVGNKSNLRVVKMQKWRLPNHLSLNFKSRFHRFTELPRITEIKSLKMICSMKPYS